MGRQGHGGEAPDRHGRQERPTADVEDLAGSSVTLAFRSSDLKVTGKGEPAHDVPKVQEVMQRVELSGGSLVASGATTLKQRDFAIKPISVAGVVNVKDELRLDFQITAREAR